MASVMVGKAGGASAGGKLLACVAGHGSAAHPYPSSEELLKGPDAWRNLADAVHFLCTLHGRQPGAIDHAANRAVEPDLRAWFADATIGFAAERAYLARLAVAAGPLPSTPGAGDNEAAALGQRHAIEMLACSERNGCALGAALALVLDWPVVRGVLDVAAQRFGVEIPPSRLAEADGIRRLADGLSSAAVERALLFGAEQIALQHFGLWDLLEARSQARAGC
ncbi:MAG TPA: hypothetical protein VGW34_15410 [Allosphingosinicella sp.]|nr:hypothetical protein [Allosphingosinicella sp.]